MLLALAGCDERSPSDNGEVASERISPIMDAEPHSWLVAEGDAPQAKNPEFGVDDAVVLDELDLPDGARARIVELPDDAGLGIVWLGAPPKIGDVPAPDYSPLELSQAYVLTAGRNDHLSDLFGHAA